MPGGVTNNLYKTDALLLRRVFAAGVRWRMGAVAADYSGSDSNVSLAPRENAHGVTLSEQTDSSFTATTNDTSQLDGTGVAYFVFDGVNWTIERYEFQ